MSFDHFERFFLLSAIGLGLILAGAVNLALGRRGGRVGLRAVATLALCALPVAALATVRPDHAARAAGVLAGVLTASALLGSVWFTRQLTALFALARRPAARWGLVATGGLSAVLVGGMMFEASDARIAEQDMRELELILGKPNTQPSSRGRATTDRGTAVALKEAVAVRPVTDLSAAEERLFRDNAGIRDQVMRRGGPNDDANCHGWVFTGGLFFLGSDDVELILQENGYRSVSEPRVGDVAIYRQGGVVSHTAVVRYVAEGQPVMVEGKWGTMGVYLHPADKSFYGTDYTFYRSTRRGHLLAGLGDGTAPEPTPAAHTE